MFLIKWFKRLFRKKGDTKPANPPQIRPEPTTREPEPQDATVDSEYVRLKTGEKGLDLIKLSEGLHRKGSDGLIYPYIDPVGIPTIGWGSITYENDRPVKMTDQPITIDRADFLLRYELEEKEIQLNDFLKKNNITFTQNEFDAVMSFAYNLGVNRVTRDSSINRAILSGDRERIASAFGLYVKGRVKVFGIPRMKTLAGLVVRRERERKLFLNIN